MVKPRAPLDSRPRRHLLDRADLLLHQAGRTTGLGRTRYRLLRAAGAGLDGAQRKFLRPRAADDAQVIAEKTLLVSLGGRDYVDFGLPAAWPAVLLGWPAGG